MKDRMDLLYRETVQTGPSDLEAGPEGAHDWEPSADILEDDREWVAIVDLPGVSENDMSVELESSTLTLKGKRSQETGKRMVLCQRPQGTFKKEWALPENIERDRISADYRNGVLKIVVPKKPGSFRKVPVRAEI